MRTGASILQRGLGIRLSEAKLDPLLAPGQRQPGIGHQLVSGELGRLPPSDDARDNVRRQERQAQEARDVG